MGDGFVQKLRDLFGLDIREKSDLELFLDKKYKKVPMPAYENKRKIQGLSYPVFLSELITPDAWKVEQIRRKLTLSKERISRVRSVGNIVARKLTWTDDKNLDASGDYYLYPAEVLTLQRGDCEDHTLVMCSLLPEDLGAAYGFKKDDRGRYGHAYNVFLLENELWVLDTVGDDAFITKLTPESGYEAFYVFTKNNCYRVKFGVEFGDIAGWDD